MNVVAGPNPLEFLLLLLLGGGFGLPSGVPPTQEDPLAAKVAPAECLFYASWAGTGTPDKASANQTEQLLAEPEIQAFLTQGRTRLLDVLQAAPNDPAVLPVLEDVRKMLELVQGKPGAFYLSELEFRGDRPLAVKGAGVLRVDEDAAKVQEVLDRLQGRVPEGQRSSVQVGSRTFSRVLLGDEAPPITWGISGKYLLVGIGDGALEGLMQQAGGQAPGWLNDLRTKLTVPRISSLMYIDVSGLVKMAVQQSVPEAERVVAVLGLDKIRSFATISGMDDTGCVSRSLLAVDGAGTGLLSWIDAKPLAADDLKVIDGAAPAAVAVKLNAAGLLDLWLDLAGQIEPQAADEIQQGLAGFQQQIGINLREDLLASLGDTWRIFAQPGPGGLIYGWTIAIQVRDREKLERVQETLLTLAKNELERAGPGAPALRSETVNGHTVHTLAFDQPGVPVAPSWCLTDNELFIAALPQTVKSLLSGGGAGSLAQRPDVAPLFADHANTLALVYVDTGEVVKTLLPLVPALMQALPRGFPPLDTSNLPPSDVFLRHLRPSIVAVRRTGDGIELDSRQTLPGGNLGGSVPVLVALALPAVQAAREAARRTQSNNNLRQIGVSLHNYHDTYRAFPAGYNADADGKPLLSCASRSCRFSGRQHYTTSFI